MRAIIIHFFSYKQKKLNHTILNIINGFYKIIQYILNNPGKVITLGLLGQVSVNNTANHTSSMSFNYLDTLLYSQNFSSYTEKKENLLPISPMFHAIKDFEISKSKNAINNSKSLESFNSFDNHCQMDSLKIQIIKIKTELINQAILECVIAIEADNIKISKFKWNSILAMKEHNQWHEGDVQKIVKEAYADNLDNFYKIDHFIQKSLSGLEQKIVGYETLLQKLEHNNHLTISTIMTLKSQTQNMKNHLSFSNLDLNYQSKFNNFKIKLNQYEKEQKEKESIMLECAAAIRSENLDHIKIKCQETKALNENNQWNDGDIQSMVLKLYADNRDNFWRTDQFIRYELSNIQNTVIAYEALYEALIKKIKLNDQFQAYEIILLNARIQEYKERFNDFHISQKYKDKFESMKSQLELQLIKLELSGLTNCLTKKIDVHIKDKEGYTPLHKAAEKGYWQEVQCFLKIKGGNIEANTFGNQTPLHLAAAYGHLSVVQYLQNQGANIEAKNESGNTPLHLAALNGHLSIVQYLKNQGANTEARTDKDKTPLQLAILKGHSAVVQYLQHSRQEYRLRRSLKQQQKFLFHHDPHHYKNNDHQQQVSFQMKVRGQGNTAFVKFR